MTLQSWLYECTFIANRYWVLGAVPQIKSINLAFKHCVVYKFCTGINKEIAKVQQYERKPENLQEKRQKILLKNIIMRNWQLMRCRRQTVLSSIVLSYMNSHTKFLHSALYSFEKEVQFHVNAQYNLIAGSHHYY